MTIKTLPVAPEGRPFARQNTELPTAAFERWDGGIRAAGQSGDNTISILDTIGEDWFGDGVTASRISGALRSIGGGDVTVNINSPGGDMWEGLAIYNLLVAYEGKVTVKVLGIAASAASIIAMAGDEIQMGRGAFLMIHNCWTIAAGNRNDFRAYADSLEPFDKAMADIYAARSGLKLSEVQTLMDNESFISGSDAIDKGFADSLLSADEITSDDESPAAALRKIDAFLAKGGMPRSERRKHLKALGGKPGAATEENDKPGAVDEIHPEALNSLKNALASLGE
ncbi:MULTISPECIES: head maturation protease, ClpP-related [Pantoea]|uniref:head maturation protease, ClpP-related n=1 Tax=Pantoea TaxID=53335 RepID=UPI000CF56202|nr:MULTISPECIES: head maturation protease, ClpP-related [Pantoea]PQL04909.1 peptidase S14 [Pantoea ananatis]PVY85584.1 ATP-dependent protease ClpP protease subunit [Pantoea ananatis]QIE96572.1 Clp protease ClpP [Pantoea stewartii]